MNNITTILSIVTGVVIGKIITNLLLRKTITINIINSKDGNNE